MITLLWIVLVCIACIVGYLVGAVIGYERGRRDYQEARERAYYASQAYNEQHHF